MVVTVKYFHLNKAFLTKFSWLKNTQVKLKFDFSPNKVFLNIYNNLKTIKKNFILFFIIKNFIFTKSENF